MHALDEHRSLELCEHAAHGKHCLTGSSRAVHCLLVQIQRNSLLAQIRHKVDDVVERLPETINGPSHHNIKPTSRRILGKLVKRGPPILSLRAGNARILIYLSNQPAAVVSNSF
jgi:hypothetical protein